MNKKTSFQFYIYVLIIGGVGTVVVPTRIPLRRLLIITNVTDGIIIYNFADSNKERLNLIVLLMTKQHLL